MIVDSSGLRTKSPSGRRIRIYKMLKSQFRILKLMLIPNESFDNFLECLDSRQNENDHQFDNLAGSNWKFHCVFLYFCPLIHFYYAAYFMLFHPRIFTVWFTRHAMRSVYLVSWTFSDSISWYNQIGFRARETKRVASQFVHTVDHERIHFTWLFLLLNFVIFISPKHVKSRETIPFIQFEFLPFEN